MKIIIQKQRFTKTLPTPDPSQAFVTTPTRRAIEGGHETGSGVGREEDVVNIINNYFNLEVRQQATNTQGKSLKRVSGFDVVQSLICCFIVSQVTWWMDFYPVYLRPEVISKGLLVQPFLASEYSIHSHLQNIKILTREVFA